MFESFYGNEMRNKLKKMTETFKRGRQQKTAQHLCCIYRPDPPRVPLCNRIPYSYCCLSYKNQQTQSIISPIISTESSSLPPTGRWIPPCLASPFLYPRRSSASPQRLAGNQALVRCGSARRSRRDLSHLSVKHLWWRSCCCCCLISGCFCVSITPQIDSCAWWTTTTASLVTSYLLRKSLVLEEHARLLKLDYYWGLSPRR